MKSPTGAESAPHIKAITTSYEGYRFRSRLEARWAVFFDHLGIKWEYEKEGFNLKEPYGCYLPDFWLPELNQWIEIKGDLPKIHWTTTEEEGKTWALAAYTQKEAFIFFGLPDFETPYTVFHPKTYFRMRVAEPTRGNGIVDWCPTPLCDSEHLGTAVDAAKSARFEFGESGAK